MNEFWCYTYVALRPHEKDLDVPLRYQKALAERSKDSHKDLKHR